MIVTAGLLAAAPPAFADTQYGGSATNKNRPSGPPMTLVRRDNGRIDVRMTVELLRVSAGIAALSGLYYSVAVLTDSTYREEFLGELIDDLRSVFADRARYLELKRQAATL